jgi:hypothetical protein
MLRRMTAILFLLAVIAVCVLAAAYGTDSRHVDTHSRRNL